MTDSPACAKTLSPFSGRLLCNLGDWQTTVSNDLFTGLNAAAAHIIPLNRNIRGELSKHRIVFLGSGVHPGDLGLVNWVEQR